jgi:RNA polymerase sigma factor (sigma-70 family)
MREIRNFFSTERLSRSTPDEELIKRCLEGDEAAWNALVDKYKDLVWSVPMKYHLTAEDGADIFQEVWMDLYSDLKGLRHVGALRSWLVTTASHKCYHLKMRQQAMRRIGASGAEREPADETPSVAFLTVETEREQILRETLQDLPPRCQELVRMLFFEEPSRPYEDVARQLGLAVGSIGFIRGRCLKKLRRLLAERAF